MTKTASMQAQNVICDYLNAKPELSRVMSDVANDIARMIDDARSAALEEAAKVAEDEPEMDDDVPLSVLQLMHAHPVTASKAAVTTAKRSIASAIRALKEGARKP